MAQASITEVFDCSVNDFFRIISDYEKYPEFLSEVKACHILENKGNRKKVEMSVSVVKSITYSLWMTETEPNEINWDFAGGDLFKTMKGSWKLADEAGKCRATYTLEASFGMFVPGPIAKGLIEVNLPNMMSSYHKRVRQLYRK